MDVLLDRTQKKWRQIYFGRQMDMDRWIERFQEINKHSCNRLKQIWIDRCEYIDLEKLKRNIDNNLKY